MMSWQAERFASEHQAHLIAVMTSTGTFDGQPAGIRFDRSQRRLCLQLTESRWRTRSIPVDSIRRLRAL